MHGSFHFHSGKWQLPPFGKENAAKLGGRIGTKLGEIERKVVRLSQVILPALLLNILLARKQLSGALLKGRPTALPSNNRPVWTDAPD